MYALYDILGFELMGVNEFMKHDGVVGWIWYKFVMHDKSMVGW